MASIYLLGDSHTQALGPRLQKSLSGDYVTSEAFAGHSTRRAHAKASIPTGQDVVAIALGGNDFGDQAAARRALVADVTARNPRAQILWFGPAYSPTATVGARHDAQAEAQRRQLPGLGVRWHDSRPWTRTGHRDDLVHFTMAAYTKWANAMATRVRSAVGSAVSSSGGGGGGGGGAGGIGGAVALVALGGLGLWWWSRR
jgi:lysophospholipase L1-like esterase